MVSSNLLVWLSIVTLVIVVGLGVFQFVRVRNSQSKRGETPGGMAGPSKE